MNAKPDQPGCQGAALAAAQRRIAELDAALAECRQELRAASAIIQEQDFRIEELKAQLEGADRLLDEGAEFRKTLERRLAEAEAAGPDEACFLVIPTPLVQARRDKK